MIPLHASNRARSFAPPLFALIACVVFAFVVMASTGCAVSPDTIDTIGGVVESTEAIATTGAVMATGGPATPWGSIVASIVGLAYAELRVRRLAYTRDKRKERGEDPLQLAGVSTPPTVDAKG